MKRHGMMHTEKQMCDMIFNQGFFEGYEFAVEEISKILFPNEIEMLKNSKKTSAYEARKKYQRKEPGECTTE